MATTVKFVVCDGCGDYNDEKSYQQLEEPDNYRVIFNRGEKHEMEIVGGWKRVTEASDASHVNEYFYCPDCQ